MSVRVRATVRHPRTHAYQQRRGDDWLPDPVTDTSAKRRREGLRRLLGPILRLCHTQHDHLAHVVVTTTWTNADFYRDAPLLARSLTARIFGHMPYYARLALSRTGTIHIHALVAMPGDARLPARGPDWHLHVTAVVDDKHLENLARYFSRPSDERACRPDYRDSRIYTVSELQEQRLAASEMYLQAKGAQYGRLPRRSWTGNLPYLPCMKQIPEVSEALGGLLLQIQRLGRPLATPPEYGQPDVPKQSVHQARAPPNNQVGDCDATITDLSPVPLAPCPTTTPR